MQRLSAWRDDKSSTKMTAGSIKRRRMKHKIIVDQENVHDDTVRSQVSQASRVLKSPISAQRSSPLSAPRVSPVALSHAQPNALFSPVKSKSELKHFFKRERIKKVKSILKSTRSLPNVKEGRSVSEHSIQLFAFICVNAGVTFGRLEGCYCYDICLIIDC